MNLLVLVLSSQLLYYLLIAQTGVVGAFDSHIHDLYPLPIGGVLGSLLSAYWRHHGLKQELYFMFGTQIMISAFYPNYSLGLMLVLGFIVGYTTPLLLHAFKDQSKGALAIGLGISYAIGTAFYTYPFDQRGWIAVGLPLISMAALYFSTISSSSSSYHNVINKKLVAVMVVWIFADSALFETLSRTPMMDIWSHYTLLIIATHLAGVWGAYRYGGPLIKHTPIIIGLFALSYGAYYLQEPLFLAVIYPIAISYYNVLLFRELTQMGDVRAIAISMIGVGWVAASCANIIALEKELWVALIVLVLLAVTYPFYMRRNV